MQGLLAKMKVRGISSVHYQLPLSEQYIDLNPLIGHSIKLVYTGNIFCLHCHKKTKKSFSQGYCYPCFRSLAQCDLCMMKPETCHHAQGTCRDFQWADNFCMQPHIVYLANSSGIKVGITRPSQLPIRWIDQGAVQALPIFKVASRYLSGRVEVVMAQHVSDKTSWQKMLKAKPEAIDLITQRDELLKRCEAELTAMTHEFGESAITLLPHESVVDIDFPIHQYPLKITSLNFDKQAEISGVLHGIKGQYLFLDTGVLNIRKFTGYEVKFII